MAITATQLTQLYLAYFGRPPDFDGYNYYLAQPTATVQSVAAAFSASPESKALYGSTFGAAQVNAIYQNLFNRDAEAGGITYWTTEVNSGRLSPALAAWAILIGAQGSDATAVANKMTIATNWLAHLDTTAEIVGYGGYAAVAVARDFVHTVTDVGSTLTSAQANLDTKIAEAVFASRTGGLSVVSDVNSVNEGSTVYFTLSTIGVAAGTNYSYTITGVSAADVVGGSLTGVATIDANGKAVVAVSLTNDRLTEGNETIVLTATAPSGAGVSKTVTAVDTSLNPAVTSVTNNTTGATIGEGGTVVYTINTYNMDAGTEVNWSLSGTGLTSGDVAGGALSGTAIVGTDGKALVSVTYTNDLVFEASESVTFTAGGQTSAVTVTNADPVYSLEINQPTLTVDEGASVTYTLRATNTAVNTPVTYTIVLSGGATAADIGNIPLTGTAIIGADGRANVTVTTVADLTTDPGEKVKVVFNLPTGGTLTTSDVTINDTSVSPTYTLTNAGNVTEGQTAVFTLATTNVAAGTVFNYTLSGTGINAADVLGGQLTGVATIGADGKATISFAFLNDLSTEGLETATLTVAGQTSSVLIGDTSTTPVPVYSVTPSANSVNEGQTVTYTINTTNVAAGTVLNYTLTGVQAADVGTGALTGSATVGADGKATVTVTLLNDLSFLEGNETMVLTVNGTGASASVLVVDTSQLLTNFTLTSGQDSIVGSVQNDTFIATNNNLNAGDIVDGAGGNADMLSLSIDNAATAGAGGVISYAAFQLSNTENFQVDNDKAASVAVFDMSSSSGVMTLIDTNSSADVVFNYANMNADSDADGFDELNVQALNLTTGTNLTVDIRDIAAPGSDEANILVTNSENLASINSISLVATPFAATGAAVDQATASGIEMVNLSTAGSSTQVNILDFNTPGSTVLNITSAVNLSIGDIDADGVAEASDNALSATIDTINAGTVTGNLVFATDDNAVSTTITLGSGNDNVLTGAGKDTVFAGAGNDTISTGDGNDSVEGGDGNDTIDVGIGSNTAKGDAGNDTITASGAATTNLLMGGTGNDTITNSSTGSSVTTIDGGDGNDTLTFTTGGAASSATMLGGLGNDVINTGDGNVSIDGGDGNDTVNVGAFLHSNTLVPPAAGSETVGARATTSWYEGGAGTDTLNASGASGDINALDDVGGFEAINLGGAAAWVINVSDNSTFDLDTATNTVITVTGGATLTFEGNDLNPWTGVSGSDVTGSSVQKGDDKLTRSITIISGAGSDSINTGLGNDSVDGKGGSDTIKTDAGNDTVTMGTGVDVVDLGSGDDRLVVIAGDLTLADAVAGNTGNDTIEFQYGTTADGLSGTATTEAVTLGALVTGIQTLLVTDASDAFNNGTMTVTIDAGYGNLEPLGSAVRSTLIVDGTALDAGESLIFNSTALGTDTGPVDHDFNVKGGAGADTMNFGRNLDSGDTVDGGNGTDTIVTEGPGIADAAFTNVTNVEVLQLTTGGLLDVVTISALAQAAGIRTVTGSADDDNVDATGYTVGLTVNADTGNDTVATGAGNDTIDGGAGNDVIAANAGDNSVIGGAGNDAITTGGGNNIVYGDDTLGGGTGNDTITTGAGNDTVWGGGGNDVISVGAGNDVVRIGTGTDVVTLGSGINTVEVTGTGGTQELDYADTIDATGGSTDTINLRDVPGGAAVTANIDLDTVQGVEFFTFTDTDSVANANNATNTFNLTFKDGNVTTLTQTTINASNLGSDDGDKINVDLSLLGDKDFAFSIIGGGGDDVVTGSILPENLVFRGGAGADTLNTDGTDMGSTTTFDGESGVDTVNMISGFLSDDSFVGVSNIEIVTATGIALNAQLGASADASLNAMTWNVARSDGPTATTTAIAGSVSIGGTVFSDTVVVNPAFLDGIIFNLGGAGADSFDASASSSAVTFLALASELDTFDSLKGGTSANDSIRITATGATADLSTMSGVEKVVVVEAGDLASSVSVVNATFTNTGGTITVDASALDDDGSIGFGGEAGFTLAAGGVTGANRFVVTGGTGADAITTGSGNDVIDAGADYTFIGAANDTVSAGDGNNSVTTRGGADMITSGTGNDTISSGEGADTISSGSGDDSINGGNGANSIDAGAGADTITTGTGADSIVAGTGNDVIDSGSGADTIKADAGDDSVSAGDGNDLITGAAGNDTINAGTGDDQIFGGAGIDSITTGTGHDTLFYTARGDSSTSTGRDVVTDFTATNTLATSDIIDIRYVAEAIAKYGAGATIFFAGNLPTFGSAQGAVTANDGILDIVYQQDENALWVDLNDDGVLNGNDIQIVLSGTASVTATSVLDTAATGFVIGQTNVPSGTSVTGTMLDERFILQGAGPWTLDGGEGTDTVVIGSAGAGTSIATSSISNVEIAEIAGVAGVGGATMTVAQHNAFTDITLGAGNTFAGSSITLTTAGAVTGDASIGTYNLANAAGNNFVINTGAQSVNGGTSADTIRSGLGVDTLTGAINGGGGVDTFVMDSGDDVSGATFTSIESTVITGSTVAMSYTQHGSTGANGTLGTITDEGDAGASTLNPGTTNTVDTVTLKGAAITMTGLAAIESYNLDTGNDDFTVGAAGQNVATGAGTNTVRTGAISYTGTINGQGTDTLVATNTNLMGGTLTSVEVIDVNGTVSMTAAQHNAQTAGTGITATGFDDTLSVGTVGTIVGDADIATYNVIEGSTFTMGAAGQTVVEVNDSDPLTIGNQPTVVNLGATSYTGAVSGFETGDTLKVVNGTNMSGMTGVTTTSLTNGMAIDFQNNGSTVTMNVAQHNAGTANFANTTGSQTINLSDSGTVTGNANIETYVLQANTGSTFTLGATGQNVTETGTANNTLVFGANSYTGTLTGFEAGDNMNVVNNTNVSGVNAGATLGAGANINFQNAAAIVTMTVAQHNAATMANMTGAQTISLSNAGTLTGVTGIESYVLGNGAGNDFTFSATAGVAQQTSVTTSGNNNDTIRTGLATSFQAGTVLNLAGNAGGVGDLLVVTTTGTNLSAINGGAETTAETLNIDNIANVSMTVAQHTGFTAGFMAAGVNTVTLTDGGSINADAGVENYQTAAAGNTITVHGLNTAVNITGAGGPDTVVVNNLTVTGNYALAGGTDTIVATNGANIAGVNAGAATTAENLNLTGGITMTQAQHQAFTTIVAGGGSDSVTITTAGAITAADQIETYNLSSGGANSITVNSAKTGVNINGNAANVTTVNVGGLTVNGTYALANAADIINATTGASIAGVNTGNATTAETLNMTGSVSMTEAQHDAFTTLNASTGADTVVLTIANGDGNVAGNASVESYTLGGNTAYTFTLGTTGQNVTETGTANNTLVFGNATYTSTLTGFETGDVMRVVNGTNLAGVNAGAAFGGGSVSVDFQNSAAQLTITTAQHNASTFTNLTGAQTIVLTTTATAGTTGVVGIENYNLANLASNDFTLGATTQNVTGTGAQNDIIRTGALTSYTGTADAAGGAADQFYISTTGTDISGATLTGFEQLFLDNNVNATMTILQNAIFQSGGNAVGTNTVTLTDAGVATGASTVETYNLANGVNTFTLGSVSQNVNGGTGADTIISGGTLTGNWALAGGTDVFQLNAGANVTGVNSGAALTAETVALQTFNLSMNVAQHNAVTTFTNGAGTQTVTITDTGSVTANTGVEAYVLAGSGNDTISFTSGTAQSVSLSGGGQDTVLINNVAFNGAAAATPVTVTNFGAGSLGGDLFNIQFNGVRFNTTYTEVFANSNLDVSALSGEKSIFEIVGGTVGAGTLTNTADGSAVEVLIRDSIGTLSATGLNQLVIVYDANGDAGLYHMVATNTAMSNVNQFSVELVGVVTGVGANALVSDNFGV